MYYPFSPSLDKWMTEALKAPVFTKDGDYYVMLNGKTFFVANSYHGFFIDVPLSECVRPSRLNVIKFVDAYNNIKAAASEDKISEYLNG